MSTTMTSPAQQLEQELNESGLIDSRSDEFYQELVDNGIESLEQFEESYQGLHQTEGDFVEELLNDCYVNELPTWVHIDYQRTWNDSLSYDYFSIEIGVQGYEIFRVI
tara:strand:+ start:498 stop:821 length:324 start_codon:yes stop_codon:yes gene_type:complete